MKLDDVPYPKLSMPYAIASGFYSGLTLPWARGTIASAISVIFGAYFLSYSSLFLGSLIWFFIGWWSISKIEEMCDAKYHDASIFVADEWCGQWLILAATLYIYPEMPIWQTGFIAFIAFRLFDIAKPWPISKIDAHISGGFGVMLDDVIAATIGSGLLLILSKFI